MKKTGGFTKKRRDDLIFYSLFIAYPILQFCIFYIGVHANSILLAFKEYTFAFDGATESGYKLVWFENFKRVFADLGSAGLMRSAWKNTIVLFLITVASSPLSVFVSYYIYQKRFASGFFRTVLYLPMVISPLVIVIMFRYYIEEAVPGVMNQWFGVKFPRMLSEHKWNSFILYFYYIIFGMSSHVLMYCSAMGGIDDSIMEAAKLDGADGLKLFYHIVFKMIYSIFVTFFVTSLATLFTADLNMFSFFGYEARQELYNFGYYFFNKTAKASIGEYPYLAAMGLVFSLITIPLVFGSRAILRKVGPTVD